MTIDVEALIAGAKKTFEQAEPEDVQILMGEEAVTARFWPLSGREWRDLVAAHPARSEEIDGKTVVVQADRVFNFNADTLTSAYPRVALVQGDDVTDLTLALWGRVLSVLDGNAVEGIAATIFYMNVIDPAKRLAAAGKASKGERSRKLSSPANLE